VEEKEPGFQVVVGAVRAEVAKWDEYAAKMEPVHSAVSNARLEVTAFFVADPMVIGPANADTVLHQAAYEEFRSVMEGLLDGAKKEFPQIADALVKCANAYEQAEEINELNINEIYTA
jgi:hypothetical protein